MGLLQNKPPITHGLMGHSFGGGAPSAPGAGGGAVGADQVMGMRGFNFLLLLSRGGTQNYVEDGYVATGYVN